MRPRLRAVTPRTFRLLDQPPRFVSSQNREDAPDARSPAAPLPRVRTYSTPLGTVRLRYRVSRWQHIDQWATIDDEALVRRKSMFGLLMLDGEIIGAMEIVAYDADCMENRQFWDIMDSSSHLEMLTAEALCSSWEWLTLDVVAFGYIVDFRNVWIKHRFAKGGWWAPIARDLVKTHFGRGSIIVSLTFALEYEGNAEEGSLDADRSARRRKALRRYAGMLFGMKPLPGAAGRDGWVWAAFPRRARYIGEPEEHNFWND